MLSVSLCLIVRNEARFLARCLASASGAADELVVVDTGSTDDTKAIALRAGARVVDLAWADDFAQARNAAVRAASGRWLLQLDADECLTPDSVAAIRRFTQTSTLDCGLFGLHDAARLDATREEVTSGAARLGERLLVPRLFRNVDGFAYSGRIHEDPSAWLARRGMRLGPVGADIIHYGRVPEIAEGRKKSERNIGLLETWRDSDAADFSPLGYLACELLERGDIDAARSAANEGFKRLSAGRAPSHRAAIRLAVARAAIALQDGDPRAVMTTVRVAVARDGEHPDYHYLVGQAAEILALGARGRARARWLAEAARAYGAALALSHIDYAQRYVPGSSSWAAHVRLGTVKLMAAEWQAALTAFDAALPEPRAQREASLGRVEALLGLGRAHEALAAIEPLLATDPDGWLLGATAAEAVGALDDAAAMLEAATQWVAKGYVSPHRKPLHLDVITRFALYGGSADVTDGAAGVVAAIATRRPFHPRADLPAAVALAWIGPLVQNLAQLGASELIEPFFSERAQAAIPGCKDAALSALALLGMSVTEDDAPDIVIIGAARADDARLAGAVFGAHPRFQMLPVLGASPTAELAEQIANHAAAGKRPLVVSDDAFAHANAWADRFPRAQLVLVGRDQDDIALDGEVVRRTTAMARTNLLQSPVASIEGVLAFLGEISHPGPIQSLARNFPEQPQ